MTSLKKLARGMKIPPNTLRVHLWTRGLKVSDIDEDYLTNYNLRATKVKQKAIRLLKLLKKHFKSQRVLVSFLNSRCSSTSSWSSFIIKRIYYDNKRHTFKTTPKSTKTFIFIAYKYLLTHYTITQLRGL